MMTIAKTTKKAQEVLAQATACKVYCLDNYFNGEPCSIEAARKALYQFSFAKLKDDGSGKYTVRVHGNLWYELS